MPIDDKYSTTRNEMLDQLAYAMGGRVAEEIVFHDPTTGASNDIEKATGMARKMVTEYGMSERVGAIKLGQSSGEVFLGRDMGHQRDYSEEVAGVVDEEVRQLIEAAHDEAWQVLNDNRDVLDRPGPRAAREGDARHRTSSPRSSRRSASGPSARSGCPASAARQRPAAGADPGRAGRANGRTATPRGRRTTAPRPRRSTRPPRPVPSRRPRSTRRPR